MNTRELIIGITLVVVSSLAFRIALPRDGQVRGFQRSEAVQAYYTVLVIGTFALGVVNIITGLVP